ncbi:MAG: hypothetical protein ACKO6G_06910 [Vulcanococcus sp.]
MDSLNLLDLVLNDAPAHEISDAIKDVLYAKAADRIEAGRPVVAADLFGDEIEYEEDEDSTQEEEDV